MAGPTVDTTPREFELMTYMVNHRGQVFSRAELLDVVWHSSPEWQDPSTVTVHIRKLRRKIERDLNKPLHLKTVWGGRVQVRRMRRLLLGPRRIHPSGVSWLVLASAMAATATGLAAVFVATTTMYLSNHERKLMLVVLLGAFVLAVLVAKRVSRPLVEDLDRLAKAARRVAEGDLSARTEVTRLDEVGAMAASFDDMVSRLEKSERLRSSEEAGRKLLIASVGHDLRTPLTAIRAAVEAIEDGVVKDPARYLRAVRSDVDHLSRLVDDLFLLAQLDAGRFVTSRDLVDLPELVDEAAEALLPTAVAAGVGLEVRITGEALVNGTPHDLGRVLHNLVDNAIRHAPPGGTVKLIVTSRDGAASVVVVDDGPGFDPAFLPRALEPFAQSGSSRDRSIGGDGLGLAIAKGVVEAHGGGIEIEPGPGGVVATSLPRPD